MNYPQTDTPPSKPLPPSGLETEIRGRDFFCQIVGENCISNTKAAKRMISTIIY